MIKTFAKGINFLAGSILKKSNVFLGGSLDYLQRNRDIDRNYFDYVRLATLELVSNEINKKNLEGHVAELGVYKGKFARYINKFFPIATFTCLILSKDLIHEMWQKKRMKNYLQGIRIFLTPPSPRS